MHALKRERLAAPVAVSGIVRALVIARSDKPAGRFGFYSLFFCPARLRSNLLS